MRTNILKANAHFVTLNLFNPGKKGFKEVIRLLSILRTGCWNWIVILSKKRIPVNYWKILSQYTVRTTKIDRQRFETFCPRKTSDSFDKYDNKQTCTWSSWQASLPFAVFFLKDQRKKDGSDFEPDTISSFQKTPASHWRANTYSFDRRKFFNMVHLHFDFTFSKETLCYCLWAS